MADAVSTYAIDLEDGTSGAAESAANALANLQKRLNADTAALGEMNKALRNLKGGSNVSLEQVKALTEQIKLQKDKIAGGQQSIISLGGSFNKLRPKPTRDGLAELAKTAQGMPGPLGGVVSKISNLKGLLAGNLMRVALIGIAAALVALAVAAVYATGALLKYAIAQAGARRSELLRLEALTKMRNWWGLAAGNAKEMQAAIDRASASTTLGRDKVADYAKQLYQAGFRGKNFEYALDGMAIKAAAVGEEGAQAFKGWAAGINMTGGSVKRLSDDVKARFGGIVAAQMLDLNVQSEKMRENFGRIFGDLKIEPMLKGLASVFNLFSQSTRSGQAMKALAETMLQPLVDAVTYAAPLVKRFFQGIIIAALLVGIGLLTLRNTWRKVFGSGDLVNQTYLARGALIAGGVAAGVLAVALATVAAPLAIIAAGFYAAAVAGSFLWKWLGIAYDKITAIDWAGLGHSIVEGIVNGLTGSAKWLIDSVSELGTSALAALKDKLGIASPSKAFARLGVEIPAGIASGVEQGTPDARDAVRKLVDAPTLPDAPARAPGEKGEGARSAAPVTVTVDVGGITITTDGSKPAQGLVEDLEPAIVALFERVAVQLGANVPRGAV
jgi:hypothetical protein